MTKDSENSDRNDLNQFLNPKYPYRGNFSPQALVFNYNLQEFATKVGYITSLEISGKISQHHAYSQIKSLWKSLKHSKKLLLEDNNQEGESEEGEE